MPLELQQFPAGLELLGDVPTTVDVRVRGASGTLSRCRPGDIVAVLDLRGARSGRRLFHLTPEQVRVPFGVEVVQVTPSTVAMVFETSATRQRAGRAGVEGKPAPGFVVGKIDRRAADVEVVGPESAVERVDRGADRAGVGRRRAAARRRRRVTVGVLDPALRLKTLRAGDRSRCRSCRRRSSGRCATARSICGTSAPTLTAQAHAGRRSTSSCAAAAKR